MSYFTIFQQRLLAPFELPEEEREKIDAFLQILENSNVGVVIEKELSNRSLGGRTPYNPYRLFAAIVYAFSRHSGSLRKIEESINFDLRFMYLMDYNKPSYSTISRFCNNIVVARQKELFTLITQTIIAKYNICIDDVFIDGSKFEANANKYKFVWKPLTFHKHLNIKIRQLLLRYFSLPDKKTTFTSKEIGQYVNDLAELIHKDGINVADIIPGKGRRLSQSAKDYFLLSKYLLKALEYEEKEMICGENRNSYYKTDPDATAMTLKEDYYSGLGSNMRAGYSIQLLVAKGIILNYYVSQDRTDMYTFIPTIEDFFEYYGFYPKNVCADAGYGTLINYNYMYEKRINNYVKYQYWRQDVEGQLFDKFYFNENQDLVCMNGKIAIKLSTIYGRHCKSKNNSFYMIENCLRCKFKEYCMLNMKNKKAKMRVFEASYDFWLHKTTARNNLLSVKGIEMRVNRSSQVEGAFGVIKQDMNYERIRRRGLENVSAEIMLVCLGYNLRKLMLLIEGKAKLDYWKAPANLQPEQLPLPNIKKILKKKKRTIGKNESIRKK